MNNNHQLLVSALVTGTVASIVSSASLAALAKMEGKSAAQPTNSTSHWLHGDSAAEFKGVDLWHTGLGAVTHQSSALFWALPFEAWLAYHRPRSRIELFGRAASMSLVAGIVDYGITPRRLTPGWELTLSSKSMVAAFASLALGLAAGHVVARRIKP
jgi:hypothetical protein